MSSYGLSYYDEKGNLVTETRPFQPPPINMTLTASDPKVPLTFEKDCSAFGDCPVKDNDIYSCAPNDPAQMEANWINAATLSTCQFISKPTTPVTTTWQISSDTPLQYNQTITLMAINMDDTGFNGQYISHIRASDGKSPCMSQNSNDAALLLIIPTDLSKSGSVLTGDTFFLQCKNEGSEFNDNFLSTSCQGTSTPCWTNNNDIDEIWSFYDDSFMIGLEITKNKPVFLQKTSTKSFENTAFYGSAVVATSGGHQPSMTENIFAAHYYCSNVNYNPRNKCASICDVPDPIIINNDKPAECNSNSADMKPLYYGYPDDPYDYYVVSCCDAISVQQLINDYDIQNTAQDLFTYGPLLQQS